MPPTRGVVVTEGEGEGRAGWTAGTDGPHGLFRPRGEKKKGPARDGNEDEVPDYPRGIPLLGDGDGKRMIPTGI
jgi:hypothetical protein